MRLLVTALCFGFISTISCADETNCEKLSSLANQDGWFRPAKWGYVTESGKTYLYSAPNEKCISKKVFVIKGDYLSIYAPYDKWLYVMYVNGKTGEDFMGWVLTKNVKVEGKYEP